MSNIVKYKLQGLWNSEYPLVVNRTINIVEAHEPYDNHLGISFDRLAAFKPLLAKIEPKEAYDKETRRLSELDQHRDRYFNTINGVAKLFQKLPIMALSSHGQCILEIIKKHGDNIAPSNYTSETKRLYSFIADCMSQTTVMASLTALSLNGVFTAMRDCNIEFDTLFMARIQRQADEEEVDVRAIRIECDKVITMLWDAIDFCCNEYGKETYIPLLRTLNALNSYYKQQLALREARRKAGEDISDETPIPPPPEVDYSTE